MAIKIDFVSDVSQITRDMSSLGDRLDQAVDELVDLRNAGEDAADSLEDVSDAGRDLDRAGDAGHDAARGLEEVADAARDADRALEGTDRSLDQAGDAAERAGRDMREAGDDIETLTSEAGKDADRMADRVEDAFRQMARSARENTGKVRQSTQEDFDRAGDGVETFKDEARQNFAETMSSFDGSLEGLIDGVQGTLGGVAADLGPKGMIGAGIAAAGIGLGIAFANRMAEGINEKGELAAALAQQINEAGGALDDVNFDERMDEWGTAIQDNREWWELWQESAETGLEDVAGLAEEAGIGFETAFRGVAGTLEESEAALEAVRSKMAEIDPTGTGFGPHLDSAAKDQLRRLGELEDQIEDNVEVQEQAKEIEELRAEAIGDTTEGIKDQIDAQEELTGVISDSVTSELDYLDTLDKTREAIATNGETLDKNTAAGRDNMRALIDLRDASYDMAGAQIEAGESTAVVRDQLQGQREDFIAAAEAAGLTRDEAVRLADAYGLVPDEIITNVESRGVDKTKAELNDLEGDYDARIQVSTVGVRAAESALAALARNRSVDVTVRARATGALAASIAGRALRNAW